MLNRGPGELMSRGRKRSPSEGSAPWPVERSEFTHRLRTLLPSTKTALNEGVERVLEVARSCGCLNDGAVDASAGPSIRQHPQTGRSLSF